MIIGYKSYMSGAVLGGVVEVVVGSNFVRAEIFTAPIGSIDFLDLSCKSASVSDPLFL